MKTRVSDVNDWLDDIPLNLRDGRPDRARWAFREASRLLSQAPPGTIPEWLEDKFDRMTKGL